MDDMQVVEKKPSVLWIIAGVILGVIVFVLALITNNIPYLTVVIAMCGISYIDIEIKEENNNA